MILNCAKIRAKGRWRIFETPEFMDPISTVLQVMTGYRKKKKKKKNKKVSDKHLKLLFMRLQELDASS